MSTDSIESDSSAVLVGSQDPPRTIDPKRIKIAAVQAEPVWNDLQGSVDKVCTLIKEAAQNGAQVLGFPEVFVPGYPWSIWTTSPMQNADFVHEYMANSLRRESPEMDKIRAAVKESGMFVVLGYSERAGNSLYIAQSFIAPSGDIVLHRRKIKPTNVERSVWGDGQADSLTCVVETPFGKVGGLNCWEHMQPLLRYYEYSQGVEIHVAGWPPFWGMPEGVPFPYHTTSDAQSRVTQFMAMEGATFVLCTTQVVTEKNLEKTKLAGQPWAKAPGGGFAQIFGPDGQPLCKPLDPGEEGILYADVNLQDRDYATQMIDVVGQYSRPDLLSLNVNPVAAKQINIRGE